MGPILAAFLQPIAQQAGSQVAHSMFPGQTQGGGGGGSSLEQFFSDLVGNIKKNRSAPGPTSGGPPAAIPTAQPLPTTYQYPAWQTSNQNPIYNAMTGWQGTT